jgi:hypothetical protein
VRDKLKRDLVKIQWPARLHFHHDKYKILLLGTLVFLLGDNVGTCSINLGWLKLEIKNGHHESVSK